MDRIERLKDLIPKLKANKKIHLLKIESLEWELKFLESEKKQLTLTDVSKSFTYRDITDVAEDLANDYCNDVTDPVWRDIRQDGIKAIQAFISKHL
tara:strand:- start:1199 stop:1486 length:288 start_codon:yes stop_codon:yes gene_type:complete